MSLCMFVRDDEKQWLFLLTNVLPVHLQESSVNQRPLDNMSMTLKRLVAHLLGKLLSFGLDVLDCTSLEN